jgi:uncharacterized protein (TIGR02246 family)
MKNIVIRTITAAFMVSVTAITSSMAQDEAAALKAIRKATRVYVEAFNRGDAAALASSWSPSGTWSNPISGESVSGRENLKAGFEEFFKVHKGARLKIETQAVKLLTTTVAVEEGTADVTYSGSPSTLTGYTAIHVLKDGAWLLDRVIETDAPASHLEDGPLGEIAWLEGTWVDEAGGSSVSYQNEWVAGGRFMRRSFKVMIDGRIDMTGREIVGWDAAGKFVRSWVFDSAGGFAELRWKRSADNPDRWVKEAKGVLGSGEIVSATHIMTRLDDDRYTFEAVARERAGELLPNIDEVTVVRSTVAP